MRQAHTIGYPMSVAKGMKESSIMGWPAKSERRHAAALRAASAAFTKHSGKGDADNKHGNELHGRRALQSTATSARGGRQASSALRTFGALPLSSPAEHAVVRDRPMMPHGTASSGWIRFAISRSQALAGRFDCTTPDNSAYCERQLQFRARAVTVQFAIVAESRCELIHACCVAL